MGAGRVVIFGVYPPTLSLISSLSIALLLVFPPAERRCLNARPLSRRLASLEGGTAGAGAPGGEVASRAQMGAALVGAMVGAAMVHAAQVGPAMLDAAMMGAASAVISSGAGVFS